MDTNNKDKEKENKISNVKIEEIKDEKEMFKKKRTFKENFELFCKNLNVFIRYAIIIVTVLLVFLIAVDACFKTAYFKITFDYALEKTDYKYDNFLENLAYILGMLFIIYLLQLILSKIKLKFVIPIVLILIFITFVNFIYTMKLVPIADQGQIMILADAVYNNIVNLHANPGSYLDMFPYQFGFAYYAGTIFKVLDWFKDIFVVEKYIMLQVLNAVYSLISMIIIYFIGGRIFKKDDGQFHRHEKIILFILTVLFSSYFLFFNTHVYGNIPGLMFALIAFLFTIRFVEESRWYNIVIASISIFISICFKTNYQIFLIAIIGILGLEFLKNIKFRNIISVIVVGIIYLAGTTFSDYILEKNIGKAVPAGVPMITYIYMGWAPSNTLSSGWYTGDVINIYDKNKFDHINTAEETKVLFKNRIEHFKGDIKEFKRYALDKFESTWINPTFQTLWLVTPDGTRVNGDKEYKDYILENDWIVDLTNYESNMYYNLERFFDAFSIIIFIFAGVGLITRFKKEDNEVLILALTFIGGVIFHFVLWETKAIYVLPYYFLLLPYAAIGLNKLYENIQILLSRLKKI